MTSGRSTYLVDSNVLVYSIDPADRGKQQRAIQVVSALQFRDDAFLSVQVLGEFYNTAVTKLRDAVERPAAERAVEDFCETFKLLPLTLEVLRRAVSGSVRHQMSYWDALIWATAKLNDIQIVLTEDIQSSGAIEGVRFVNPFAPSFDLASLS